MEVISRKKYADEIEAWIGKGLVVVLTGQRRVGKSCLLKDFIQRHENDNESNLIYIDKEKKNFNAMMSSMGQMSEEMMAFMRNMRLNDMLKMAGAAISMEAKLKLNQALNQIKK